MMSKRFAVSVAAAAIFGVFGPAFAQKTVDPNVGVNANVGGPSTSSSRSGAGTSSSTNAQEAAAAGATAGKDTDEAGNRYQKPDDKKTGLERAEEAAGEHGQHGRDNARMHQSR